VLYAPDQKEVLSIAPNSRPNLSVCLQSSYTNSTLTRQAKTDLEVDSDESDACTSDGIGRELSHPVSR
jgi:hypothetical protein